MNTYAYETSSKIGWYGSYNEETIGYCESYSFDIDLDGIDTILGISSQTDSYDIRSSLQQKLECGTGTVLYSNSKNQNNIENFNLGFLYSSLTENGSELPQRLLRPPKQYFEEFRVLKATDDYEEVLGTYKLTSTFMNNHPVYRNESKNWFIFFKDGRYRLANDLVNFTKGLVGQRDKPNGIFASLITDFDYAVAEGVEEITKKECKIDSRYLLRTSTGALFEKKKPIFLLPRIPRSIDEKIITETSYADDPSHLEISNFRIAAADSPTIKYNPIIKSQNVSKNQLTMKYDASTSDLCELTTPTKTEYDNTGQLVSNLVERYNAGYMVSENVIDEPIQNKTFQIQNSPLVSTTNNKKVFVFDNKKNRTYIDIDSSVGSDVFNQTSGFSIYCKFKPSNIESSVLFSKWSVRDGFVQTDSSFKLSTDSFQVNATGGIFRFSDALNIRSYNKLLISYDYNTQKLTVFINDQILIKENFPRPVIGVTKMIIGGFFADTNSFSGFTGEIEDLRIYSKAIQSNEANLILNSLDYESQKELYELAEKYVPNSDLQMQAKVLSAKDFSSGRKYTPNGFITKYNSDTSVAVVGELGTSGSTITLTLRVFNKDENGKFVYSFEKFLKNYDEFEFQSNILVAKNPSRLTCFTLDFSKEEFVEHFNLPVTSKQNSKLFISILKSQKFLTLIDSASLIKILDITEVEKPKIIKTNSGVFTGFDNRKITHISVIGNVIASYGKNNNANAEYNIRIVTIPNSDNENVDGFIANENETETLIKRLNKNVQDAKDGKLKMNETLPIDNTVVKKLKLIEIENNLAVATTHEKNNFADARYKTANRLGMQVGFLKIHEIDADATNNLKSNGNDIVLPVYDQFGNDFMENQSFGDEFVSAGKNLLIASPNAFENSDGTNQGIIYWYSLHNKKYQLISKIFSTESNYENFGNEMQLNGNNLSVKLNQISRDNSINFPYAKNYILDEVTDQEYNVYEKKYDFEQYDDEFNLIAWYRFNEIYAYKQYSNSRAGFALFDHSGNYNHFNCIFSGTELQPNFTSPTELGMTYKFNRNSHCNVELPFTSQNIISGEHIVDSFTINIWYLPLILDASSPVLFSVYEDSNIGTENGFVLYANGDLMIGTDLNSVAKEMSLVTKINQWYMMTMIYDSEQKEIQFYVNGKLVKKIEQELNLTSGILSLGGLTHRKNPFEGYIDDLKIYKKILSQEDIDYELQKSWKFDNIKN